MIGNAASRLRSFIDRIERLKDEIKALNGDLSEVYKEAKGEGFDTAAMKALVKERAAKEKSPEGYEEFQSILDLYRHALETGTDDAIARARARGENPSNDHSNSAPSVSSTASGAAASSGFASVPEDAGAGVAPQHSPEILAGKGTQAIEGVSEIKSDDEVVPGSGEAPSQLAQSPQPAPINSHDEWPVDENGEPEFPRYLIERLEREKAEREASHG